MAGERRTARLARWRVRSTALVLALAGCAIDASGLGSVDAGESMRLDGAPREAATDTDAASDDDAGTETVDSGGGLDADVGVDATTIPDSGPPDAGPPSCAEVFTGVVGLAAVCADTVTECVLLIDVDPSRRTCSSACADRGWGCRAATGVADRPDVPTRCAVPAADSCDQNLRIQVCACER